MCPSKYLPPQLPLVQADEDEDDGMPSPAEGRSSLVSVPNPLFSGYNAFTEPFDVSPLPRITFEVHLFRFSFPQQAGGDSQVRDDAVDFS
ncbi:UNVERIFIED_CONTAM: hypothetical protein FKN15_025188 [Acipenser sinensis]